MLNLILDFIEDTDPVYLSLIGFSIIFFSVVITKAVSEVKRQVRKEKAIRKLENRYDSLCQHRSNLIVSVFEYLGRQWANLIRQTHYYWAKEDGERKTVENIKDQLIEVDEDLALLRESFEDTKTKFEKKNK